MRRSPVLRRCCFVVTVLSLSLVDAQWLNVKHYTSQQRWRQSCLDYMLSNKQFCVFDSHYCLVSPLSRLWRSIWYIHNPVLCHYAASLVKYLQDRSGVSNIQKLRGHFGAMIHVGRAKLEVLREVSSLIRNDVRTFNAYWKLTNEQLKAMPHGQKLVSIISWLNFF